MDKIVLVGYMGSGKTEIGILLSKNIDLPFYDLDNLINLETSKSINEIFAEEGEIYFRKIEHQILANTIIKNESFILSLGGGTPCYANNHLLLNQENVTSIYLKASISTLVDRLKLSRINRPLIKDLSQNELSEYIAKHLFERSFYYNQCKNTVVVDDKSMAEIVSEIEKLLF